MAEIIRTVRVEEFDAFMRFLERCYGHSKDFFPREYPHLYRPDPGACACCHILERDGRIASHVGVYQIDTVVEGISIPVGGIGGVATLPEDRGKGYMSRLLHHVIGVMREKGHLVSGLGGDRLRYNRFGWESAGLIYRLNFSRRSLNGANVEPVSVEAKLPGEAIQVIERFQTRQVCRVRRPNPALQLCKPGLRCWIAEDGYAITHGEGGARLSIVEMVSATGKESGMIRAMLDRMFSSEASWTISAWDQERLVRLLPSVSCWSAAHDWMYRIINISGLLTACKPVLERQADGLRDIDVTIGIREHDQVDIAGIAVRNSAVEITSDRVSKTHIELDPVAAARLVLGGPPCVGCSDIPPGLAALLPVPVHVPPLDYV